MKKCFVSIFLCIVLLLTSTILTFAASAYKGASGWAEPELDKAAVYGLITDNLKDNMTAGITREEFAEIAVRLYEIYTGKKALPGNAFFTDTTNPEVLKAANLKLVGGTGNGEFSPKQPVTREQMATILYRALQVIRPDEDYSSAPSVLFSDDKLIDSWATEGVYYCSKVGIIKGIQNADMRTFRFDPDAGSSREVAVIVCTRAYELISGSSQQTGSNVTAGSDTSLSDWNESIIINDSEFDKDQYTMKTIDDVTVIFLPYDRFRYVFKIYDAAYKYPEVYTNNDNIIIEWKNDQGEITIRVTMTVDSPIVDINGEQYNITAGPYNQGDQLYVPVNLFFELFEMKSETFQGRLCFSYPEDFSKGILTGTWSSSFTNLFTGFKDIVTGTISLASFEWSYTFNADGTYRLCAVSTGGFQDTLILQSGKYEVIGRTIFFYDVYETLYKGNPFVLQYEKKHMGDRLETDFIDKYDVQEDTISLDMHTLHRIQGE